jgi:arylsulfatase A-like enzyme
LIDIFRTLLDAVGVEVEDAEGIEGKSLLVDEGDRPVVAQVRSLHKFKWRSYREGGYELRQQGTKPAVLHGAEDADAKEAEGIRTRMFDILKRVAPWRQKQRPEPSLSAEERDALRKLGYVD